MINLNSNKDLIASIAMELFGQALNNNFSDNADVIIHEARSVLLVKYYNKLYFNNTKK